VWRKKDAGAPWFPATRACVTKVQHQMDVLINDSPEKQTNTAAVRLLMLQKRLSPKIAVN
jgi:hypothetical protein